MTTLRSGVILGLLIGLPALALLDRPAQVVAWLEQAGVNVSDVPFLPSLKTNAAAPATPATEAAQPLVAPQPAEAPAPAMIEAAGATISTASREADDNNGAGLTTAPELARTAPFGRPLDVGPQGTLGAADVESGSVPTRTLRQPLYRPLAAEETLAVQRIPAVDLSSNAVGSGDNGSGHSALDERQQEIGAELCRLGATAYRLERQPDGRFLFQCEFSAGPGMAAGQKFQETAADPVAAMEQVVAKVQAWQQEKVAFSYFMSGGR